MAAEQFFEQLATTTFSTSSSLPCYLVNNLTSTEEQCRFIMDNDCLEEDATFDYVYLVYCDFGYNMRYAAMSLIVFLVIVLFLNLSVNADEFLCPSLLAVAKNLRMSDSLAGVTLLAFGNGCPDIFSSLAAASNNRPDLIIGELLGAGIFCTSIVAGLVFIHSDFKLACRPILRDATFYLLAVYLIWLYCWNGEITFYGSLAFIVIYVIYLIVALSGQAIHSRLRGSYPIAQTQSQSKVDEKPATTENDWYKWRGDSFARRRKSSGTTDTETTNLTNHSSNNNNISLCYATSDSNSSSKGSETNHIHLGPEFSLATNESSRKGSLSLEKQLCSIMVGSSSNEGHINKAFEGENHNNHHHPLGSRNEKPMVVVKLTTNSLVNQQQDTNSSEWTHFKAHLNPIDCDNWHEMSWTSRAINLLRAPLLFASIITVPVVDLDKRNNNWCRLLNSLHCIMIPLVICLLSWPNNDGDTIRLFGFVPVQLLVVLPSFGLALFVYKTSSAWEPPRYHALFAYAGFVMSVLWIYLLANEIISLLKTVGIIFSMSDTAIGLGVLAWGNSLGDIVANLSLAEAGYPRMGLGASIGAPLLNLLLGFGLSFTVSQRPGEFVPIKYTPTITLLCSTLALVLGSLMLSTLLVPDRSKKLFGYLLICGYCVYFLVAVCIECNLINTD